MRGPRYRHERSRFDAPAVPGLLDSLNQAGHCWPLEEEAKRHGSRESVAYPGDDLRGQE